MLTIQGKQVSMRQLFARFSEVSAPGKPLRPVLGGHGAWYFALRRQVESKLLHRALAGSARRPARHLGFTGFTLEAELKDTTSRRRHCVHAARPTLVVFGRAQDRFEEVRPGSRMAGVRLQRCVSKGRPATKKWRCGSGKDTWRRGLPFSMPP